MRRAVLEALRLLHGDAGANGELAGGALNGEAPTLERALSRFDEVWAAVAPPTSVGQQETEDGARERPFGDVYRRYGRNIIARAWNELAEGDQRGSGSAAEVGFEEVVAIPIGKRSIALTVDRIERAATPTGNAAPTRYIRDRLGAASDRPDLRALLYTLAAEQQVAPGVPIEISQRNMMTGEREPLVLRPRQRENLRDELASAIEGILRSDFTPRPEAHRCQSCPFLLICPA
jgi:hypothetical protein